MDEKYKIDIKDFYRFIEFTSRLIGYDLTHEKFKLISLDEYKTETDTETKVKRFSDAFLYLCNNLNQIITMEIIETIYYLLTKSSIKPEISKKILEQYYIHFDNSPHYLATLIHFIVLDNIDSYKYEFAFLLTNLIYLKKHLNIAIPYDSFHEVYKNAIEHKNFNKLMIIIKQMISTGKNDRSICNKTKEQLISEIKSITPVLKNSYNVKKLYLYGSYAKNTNNVQSDVDLLVIYNKNLLNFEKAQNINNILELFKTKLNIKVDLIDFSHALEKLDICEMENVITLI